MSQKAISHIEEVKNHTLERMNMYELSKIQLKKLYEEGLIDKKIYFRNLKEIAISTVKQRRRIGQMNIINQMSIHESSEIPGRAKNPPLKVLESIARFKTETKK
jgi:hypothetical protein